MSTSVESNRSCFLRESVWKDMKKTRWAHAVCWLTPMFPSLSNTKTSSRCHTHTHTDSWTEHKRCGSRTTICILPPDLILRRESCTCCCSEEEWDFRSSEHQTKLKGTEEKNKKHSCQVLMPSNACHREPAPWKKQSGSRNKPAHLKVIKMC